MNASQKPEVRRGQPSAKSSHSRFSTSAFGRFVSKRRISRLVKNQTQIIQRHLETGSLKSLVTAQVLLAALSAPGNSFGSQPPQQPSSATQEAGTPGASLSAKAIPLDEIGATAGRQYSGNGLTVAATETGARLNCMFQKLVGEATSEGLWLRSSVTNAVKDRFRVKAAAVGRAVLCAPMMSEHALLPEDGAHGVTRTTTLIQSELPLAPAGTIAVKGKTVRFIRPGVTEEYSVSMDGIRQDFIITENPKDAGKLRVELSVTGTRVEKTTYGVRLVLANSGRKIAYSRLRATDATGRELPARIEVSSVRDEVTSPNSNAERGTRDVETTESLLAWGATDARLAVLVNDTDAVYPVRIDPTFSDENWIGLGGVPSADSTVQATVLDNEGNLYIGGSFTVVGGVSANRVAKWNGNSWSALGSGISGDINLGRGGVRPAAVLALAVSGSDLLAGGSFTNAGGVGANCIAKWNGVSWSPLGSGFEIRGGDIVFALATSGSNLYVGGNFSSAGGVVADNIANWTSNTWSAVGLVGMNYPVRALASEGSKLYAGGNFTTAGLTTAHYVASWDGNSWSSLGSGMDSPVYALAVVGSNLYAGGVFTNAGMITASHIAKWDGNSWSALASGIRGVVHALAVSGSNLYAGGDFTNSGGIQANYIAKWDGVSWSPLGSGMDNSVYSLALSESGLFVGGDFTTAGGKPSAYIAKAVMSKLQFTASPTNGTVPLTVQFVSSSTDSDGNPITQWNWDFGDGATSTAQSPLHNYISVGAFLPSLIGTNNNDVTVIGSGPSITVSLPTVQFTASPTNGTAPLTVQFNSPSIDSAGNPIAQRNWSFGDGATSTVQNPSHTYMTGGTFSPILIGTNNDGVTVVGSGPLIAVSLPKVQFTASATNGTAPLVVQFSSPNVGSDGNSIISWNWDFGDGSTSTAQNPSHTFASYGVFPPSLVATNNNGVEVIGIGPSITVGLPPSLLSEAVDAPDLTWLTGGNSNWIAQTAITHDGADAAQSGSIGNNQESWMQTEVIGPGTLTFWWKVSSELNYDWLEFYTNGVLQSGRISGNVDWQQQTFDLPAGTQTIRWRYLKDGNTSSGQDRGWVDQVSFRPAIQFAANPTSGMMPLTVQFNCPSVDPVGNSILQWNWDFGDGDTSSAQNPSHTYMTYGTFWPTLAVTNDNGNAVESIGPSVTVSAGGIGFDDLASGTAGGLSIPVGYGGLTWSNLYVLNGVGYQYYPSGYGAGVVSSSNIVFNGNPGAASISRSAPFNIVSAYLTAAWNDNLQVQVLGYTGSVLAYSNTYTLSATNATLINCNYLGVNEISFIPFGGTHHAGYNGSGLYFALDNVTVSTNSGATIGFPPESLFVSNGLFQLLLTGPENASVILERSTTLSNWTAIATNTLPLGGWPLSLPTGTNAKQFYRARVQ